MRKIYKEEFVAEELENIIEQCNQKNSRKSLFKGVNRRKMLFCIFFCFLYQFCGFAAVIQYSTLIFMEIFNERAALYLTLLVSVLKFIFYSNGAFLANKYGRRKPLLVGVFFLLIANMSIFGLSFVTENIDP